MNLFSILALARILVTVADATCGCVYNQCTSDCDSSVRGRYCTADYQCTTCACMGNMCSPMCSNYSTTSSQQCSQDSHCMSCKCVSSSCSQACSSYATAGQQCSNNDNDCTTCNCVYNKCGKHCSYIGTQNDTVYGTYNLQCFAQSDCNSCACNSQRCNSLCSPYNNDGASCNTAADCYQCSCVSGVCNQACSMYNNYGKSCSSSSDCQKCSCVYNKCNAGCSSYGSKDTSCWSDDDCKKCACRSSQCTAACSSYGTATAQCSEDKHCTSCSCLYSNCNTMGCTSYGTYGKPCSSDSTCNSPATLPTLTSCGCSGGSCHSSCGTGVAGQSCLYDSDCTECGCSSSTRTCSNMCASNGTAGVSCLSDSDCYKCQCSGGACTSYCSLSSTYNTGNQVCYKDSDCTSCSCVGGKCSWPCNQYANQSCFTATQCGAIVTTTTTTTVTTTTNNQTTAQVTTAASITTLASSSSSVSSLFDISSLLSSPSDLARVVDLISGNYTGDLTGCLLSCSNNGDCSIDSSGKFYCACDTYYSGVKCSEDSRPCSSYPCLNNGTCLNILSGSSYSFECNCTKFYSGSYCETIIDYCANYSCSGNGYCTNSDSGPSCTCYTYFSGSDCSVQAQALKNIKQMISIASIIAIIWICLLYLIMLASDLHTHFCITRKKFQSRPRKGGRRSRRSNKRSQEPQLRSTVGPAIGSTALETVYEETNGESEDQLVQSGHPTSSDPSSQLQQESNLSDSNLTDFNQAASVAIAPIQAQSDITPPASNPNKPENSADPSNSFIRSHQESQEFDSSNNGSAGSVQFNEPGIVNDVSTFAAIAAGESITANKPKLANISQQDEIRNNSLDIQSDEIQQIDIENTQVSLAKSPTVGSSEEFSSSTSNPSSGPSKDMTDEWYRWNTLADMKQGVQKEATTLYKRSNKNKMLKELGGKQASWVKWNRDPV